MFSAVVKNTQYTGGREGERERERKRERETFQSENGSRKAAIFVQSESERT